LHRNLRLTVPVVQLEHLHDVGMLELGYGVGFSAEAFDLLGAAAKVEDHLERDEPLRMMLPRAVDDAHAAAAEPAQDFITRHTRQPSRRATGPTSGVYRGRWSFLLADMPCQFCSHR